MVLDKSRFEEHIQFAQSMIEIASKKERKCNRIFKYANGAFLACTLGLVANSASYALTNYLRASPDKEIVREYVEADSLQSDVYAAIARRARIPPIAKSKNYLDANISAILTETENAVGLMYAQQTNKLENVAASLDARKAILETECLGLRGYVAASEQMLKKRTRADCVLAGGALLSMLFATGAFAKKQEHGMKKLFFTAALEVVKGQRRMAEKRGIE
ncbi:MAG: hypothetical protein WCI72_02270 [archaeon]